LFKGLNTKYSVQVSPKKHPIPAAVYGKLANLDEYVHQESDEQKRKALGAIASVAGLLPSPASSSRNPDVPRTIAREAEDVIEAAAAPAAAASPKLDEELDDLLSDLS
jgi:hypothetical protein